MSERGQGDEAREYPGKGDTTSKEGARANVSAWELWADWRTGRGLISRSEHKAFLAGVAAADRTNALVKERDAKLRTIETELDNAGAPLWPENDGGVYPIDGRVIALGTMLRERDATIADLEGRLVTLAGEVARLQTDLADERAAHQATREQPVLRERARPKAQVEAFAKPVDVDAEVGAAAKDAESRHAAICERLGPMSQFVWPYVIRPLVERIARQQSLIASLTRTVENLATGDRCGSHPIEQAKRERAPLTEEEARAWERLRDAAETIEDILITAHVDFDSDEQQERFNDARWQALDAIKKTCTSRGEIPPEDLTANSSNSSKGSPDAERFRASLLGAIRTANDHEQGRRDRLGRIVREEWIAWAKEQPNPKPSWLVPWEGLSEPDREVDRRIGARLFSMGVRAALDLVDDEHGAEGCSADVHGEMCRCDRFRVYGVERAHGVDCACPACTAQTAAMRDKERDATDDAGGDEPARWAARVQAMRDRLHSGDPARLAPIARAVGKLQEAVADAVVQAVEIDHLVHEAGGPWALHADAPKADPLAPDPEDGTLCADCRAPRNAIHSPLCSVRAGAQPGRVRPDVLASTDAGNPDDAPDSIPIGGAR